MTYLSQTAIALPFEIYPTHIRNLGLDSLAGIFWILVAATRNKKNSFDNDISVSISDGQETEKQRDGSDTYTSTESDSVPWRRPRQHPAQSALLIALLFGMYVFSGLLTPVIVTFLNIIAVFIPLTVPIQRCVSSLEVSTVLYFYSDILFYLNMIS